MNADVAKRKYFTVAKANSALPLVRAIVSDLVELYRDVSERRERLQELRSRFPVRVSGRDDAYGEEIEQMVREIEQDEHRLQGFVNELMELGVELKDPVIGLIDFPTRIEGRDAYLCWKLGEPEVVFWHELDAGFRGRQRLLESIITDPVSETGAE